MFVLRFELDGTDAVDSLSSFITFDPNFDASIEPAFRNYNKGPHNFNIPADNHLAINFDDTNTDNPLVSADEIRIGTTWADVAPVGSAVPPATDFTWNVAGGGIWNAAENWDPGSGPPNADDHGAVFGSQAAATAVIIDSAVTVRSLDISSANGYTWRIGSGPRGRGWGRQRYYGRF